MAQRVRVVTQRSDSSTQINTDSHGSFLSSVLIGANPCTGKRHSIRTPDLQARFLRCYGVLMLVTYNFSCWTRDGSTPQGPGWHRDLLLQMSGEISGRRPPVISRATRHCLDEYRSFRHIVRNIYTFNLRPMRVRELVDDLAVCFAALVNDIEAFCEFLQDEASAPGA